MLLQEILEIQECVSLKHTPYYYFKDRYALQLLAYALEANTQKIAKLF